MRHFMTVAELGSMRLASERLHISQSAISRRIQALESSIGASLFERNAQGVILTARGTLLLATARQVLAETSELSREIDALKRVEKGHVRIAAIESVLPDLLPNVLARYCQDHPNITFNVIISTSLAIVSLVERGEVDVGVTFSTGKQKDIQSVFKFPEPLLAVTRYDHPLSRNAVVSVSDVSRFPTGIAAPQSTMRIVYDQACRKSGVEFKPALETDSLALLHNFAISGLGVSILLRHTVQSSVEAGILKARRFREAGLAGSLEIIALKGRQLGPATQLFNTMLQEAIRSQPIPS